MVSATSRNSKFTEIPEMDIPVLISGGGPTGLYAAILLSKLNVPFRLVERNMEVSKLSKAIVVHARTLELFEQTGGLIAPFLKAGVPHSDFNIYSGDKLASVLPVLKNKDSFYNYGLFLEQTRTVSLLTEQLESLGGVIERGWELMDTKVIELPAGGQSWVETTLRRAKVGTNIRTTESKVLGHVEQEVEQDGKEYEVQVVRSEYLIAADGGKSVVRHKLNIAFPGRTLDNNIILFDGHVESSIPLDNLTIMNGDNSRSIATFPLEEGRIRIMLDNGVLSPEGHAAQKSEDLTMEVVQELVNQIVGPNIRMKLLDCYWLTYYRVNERLAERYTHKNRIFLAGDAAHVHSPAGGQGMNMGLQDAHNLTWKIALVLHKNAPRSILDSYEIERPPVADQIIKLSANILEVSMAQDMFRRVIRRVALTVLPYILPLIPTGPPMSMLKIRYHENNINKRHTHQPAPADGFDVGVRARDGDLTLVSTTTTTPTTPFRLHEILTGPGIFHVLVFTSDMLTNKSTSCTSIKGVTTISDASVLFADIHECLRRWTVKWPMARGTKRAKRAMFQAHVISATVPVLASTSCVEAEDKVYHDVTKCVHQKYGVAGKGSSGGIVVLRPDTYIGYRVQGASKEAWADVDGYFRSILM
ncbi:hypothetical protein BGZ93_004136 [Podila epicladia]|nr:hypothetical protein BGZ93_004136 [Podila epicladia]